jgi:hypothetical protein
LEYLVKKVSAWALFLTLAAGAIVVAAPRDARAELITFSAPGLATPIDLTSFSGSSSMGVKVLTIDFPSTEDSSGFFDPSGKFFDGTVTDTLSTVVLTDVFKNLFIVAEDVNASTGNEQVKMFFESVDISSAPIEPGAVPEPPSLSLLILPLLLIGASHLFPRQCHRVTEV